MRLDKYLKVSRLIKRRSVASVVIKDGRVLLNSKVGKPGSIVKINDIVELFLGRHFIKIKILSIKENSTIEKAREMYEILLDSIREEQI